jgi:hypothetical protein
MVCGNVFWAFACRRWHSACSTVRSPLPGSRPPTGAGPIGQLNEASPTFNHLLAMHPLAFVAGILAWMAVFVGILLLLPDTPG